MVGGDDYELLLAAPPGAPPPPGVAATRIGVFTAGQGVRVLDPAGRDLALDQRGWSHFA
jgi:thiamine-monophosphate kinase